MSWNEKELLNQIDNYFDNTPTEKIENVIRRAVGNRPYNEVRETVDIASLEELGNLEYSSYEPEKTYEHYKKIR